MQYDDFSVYYLIKLNLEATTDIENSQNVTVTVESVPEGEISLQTGFTIHSNNSISGATGSNLSLFTSYMEAYLSSINSGYSNRAMLLSSPRSVNESVAFDVEIGTYSNGSFSYSHNSKLPVNSTFGIVSSNGTDLVGKLPGYFDGYGGRTVSNAFKVPLLVKLPKEIADRFYNSSTQELAGTITFTYDYSVPVEPLGNGTVSDPYVSVPPASGHFRIWRSGRTFEGEASNVVCASGEAVPLNKLFDYRTGFPDEYYEIGLYLEAIRHSEL